jgi:hypothetical protein
MNMDARLKEWTRLLEPEFSLQEINSYTSHRLNELASLKRFPA